MAVEPFADDPRIPQVVIREPARLLLALRGVHGGRGALHGVGDAVELRRLPAAPQLVERVGVARPRPTPCRRVGTTVKAQRVPVKPAVLEKLRNSMAHSRAPGISKMDWGSDSSRMKET